jgi:hypothetical protein
MGFPIQLDLLKNSSIIIKIFLFFNELFIFIIG